MSRVEDDDDIQDYKKAWVGLTDEEILEAWHWGGCNPHIEGAHFVVLYQYIESKLKEKNNGFS